MQIPAIRIVDKHLGNIINKIISLSKRKKDIPKRPSTIACIQLWGLGESILTLPAIKALKQKYPSARITIFCTARNQQVYDTLPFIDFITLVPMNPILLSAFIARRYNDYDLLIDFEEYLNISAIIAASLGHYSVGFAHGSRGKIYDMPVNYDDKQHCAETFADVVRALHIKIPKIENLIPLPVSANNQKIVEALIKHHHLTSQNIAIIAPGAAESARTRIWPLDKFASLADKLQEKNYQVVFIGIENEADLISDIIYQMKSKPINLAGKTTLKQTAYLLTKAKIMIGNDSGPMHLSAAMGTKTIGLFGPNLPIRFAPIGKNNQAVYKATCPCSPVINVHQGLIGNCIDNDPKCMKAIEVEDVLKLIS